MKPTPVIRKEMYLNAMGAGGTIPVPSPYPRLEKYLYRLDGFDDKDIPSPENRTERYLYWLCGYRDKWIDTPVTRIDKYMYYACGYEEYGYPTPVTREEQFWYDYIQAYIEIKTLTGTLPLTFRTSETALRSWTIYGNNNAHSYSAEGTLPLTFTSHTAGAASDWSISGNDNVGVGERTANFFDENATDTTKGYVDRAMIKQNGDIEHNTNFVVSEYINIASDTAYVIHRLYRDMQTDFNAAVCFYDGSGTYLSGVYYGRAKDITFTTPYNARTLRMTALKSYLDQTMLVEGSTVPPEYIPYGYEIPISVNGTPQTFYIGDSPLTAGQSISKTSTGVDIAAIAGCNTITTDLYNKPEMSITGVDYVGVGERTKNLFNKNACELVQIDTEGTMKFGTQLDVKGGTQYTLINTNPRNVDIYILVHSESINRYQSTLVRTSPVRFIMPRGYKAYLRTNNDILTDWDTIGVTDIALYEGYLTNPSFVPYGYKIPLIITSGQQSTDYDIFIGDAPLTDGQTVTDTLTINTFEGENVLDTTLENKPQMTITYKGG